MWDPSEYEFPDLWADAKRTMPPGSPFPGKWSTDRTPYTRAPMRAFASPDHDVVVAIMRRQRGKTEIGANCLGWMWDTCPAPSLWINPTEKLGRSFAADRVQKMFATIDGLAERTYEKRPGSVEKFIGGVRFGIGWAGSRTETASHPSKYSIIDERSRMVEDIGGEGDPVRIVQAGGGMFPGATTLIISSPTEEGICPTFDWWSQGTKMRWAWMCPECGEWFVPCLAVAHYPDKASFETIRDEAYLCCPSCEHQMRDGQIDGIVADYQPSTIDEEGTITLRPGMEVRNSVASYWVTGLSDKITRIGEAMESYARAARNGKEGDLQANVNAVHGELWKVKGERLQNVAVRDRMVPEIPAEDIQLVTVGVDVQQDCLYYVVRGWCYLQTSYLIDCGRVLGATEHEDVWTKLRERLAGPFVGRPARMVLVDSGHATAMVYQQCRRGAGWAPAKGRDIMTSPYKDALVDESVSGRAMKTLRLWWHCVDTWQMWLQSRITWQFGEPGAWYVPDTVDDLDPTYCDQVVNQTCTVTRGKRHWGATGNRDDHYRDCELLAAIAADIQGVRRLKELKNRDEANAVPQIPPSRRAPNSLERRTL